MLMSDKHSRDVALGIHDDARMKADYELVREYIGDRQAVRREGGLHERVPRSIDQDDEVIDAGSCGHCQPLQPLQAGSAGRPLRC